MLRVDDNAMGGKVLLLVKGCLKLDGLCLLRVDDNAMGGKVLFLVKGCLIIDSLC